MRNTKKLLSVLFEFSILRGKMSEFRKIRIFKHNWSLCMVKKFYIRGMDLNVKIKKNTFGAFEIFELNMENR